jgi:NTE family protein
MVEQSIRRENGTPLVGLALGAGGTKGWAHVGVIKVLHEAGVRIDLVVGASAGALIGPLYAAARDTKAMERVAFSFSTREFTEWFLRGLRIAPDAGPMASRLWAAYGSRDFRELAVPFAAVAHDLETGERLTVREGLVATAVEASIRPPFFGSPTRWNGHALVDGGFQLAVPTDVALDMGATFVIGVNIGALIKLPRPLRPHSRRFAAALRQRRAAPDGLRGQLAFMTDLMSRERPRAVRPHVEIRPDMRGVSAFAPWQIDLAYRRGVAAAREALPTVKRVLEQMTACWPARPGLD